MATSPILKQDELGRVRVTQQRADELVAQYQCSGLTGRRFAAHVGVAYHTFWSWLKKRGLTASRGGKAKSAVAVHHAPRFVEVTVSTPAKGVVVQLPGGAFVALEHEQQAVLLAALLKALHPTTLT
jgi:hypothetical protein